jgi:hypothetical protein
MISQGFSNKHIARTLEISPETVKTHVKRIFLKLAVSSRAEAVCQAGWLGLLGLDTKDRMECVSEGAYLQRRCSVIRSLNSFEAH